MKIGIVVPTVKGREDSLDRCLSAYNATSPSNTTWVIVHDKSSCGEAWNEGFDMLKGLNCSHVHFTADDLEPHPGWWEPAVEATALGKIPAAVVRKPNGALEAGGGDLSKPDHVNKGPLDPDWSSVDYTGIPFLTWQMFTNIKMPPIHYYSDVWISYAGRFIGYETVLRIGYEFTHHREMAGRGAGFSVGDRNMLDGIKFRQEMIARFGAMRP